MFRVSIHEKMILCEVMIMYSVLVVDDEIRQREAVIRNVDWQRAGFEVVGDAENGIEALDQLEKLEPDLVLTDIKMPLMTGLELARKAREIRPATKFVILSGYDDFEYAQEAFKYNVIRYLLKPVSASELTDEFEKIGAEMNREFDLLKSGGSSEDISLRLEKAEFLLPLLLGTGEDVHASGDLTENAKRLGIIKNDGDCYRVVASKFKTSAGETCTAQHHIDFVNSIINKYALCESFFVNGRIITLVTSDPEEMSTKLRLPVIELVQSAKKLLNQNCTIGISETVSNPSLLALACSQAITARRYTSDGTGSIRYINDQECKSTYEFESAEKSVNKLEQLLKIGSKEEITSFLDEILSGKTREGIDYIIIQILATAHRCVSVLPDGNAAAELFTANNSFTSRLSFDFNEQYKNELVSLCLDARDIIYRSQRHESEVLCDHALQIINEEYMNEELSLTDASDRLGVSPNYLSALIKKKKSKNFVTLVTERRMKAASDLLLCTSMKIFEITQKCGYSDQHYFSYCFKKYYGVSPNKYREEHLGARDA